MRGPTGTRAKRGGWLALVAVVISIGALSACGGVTALCREAAELASAGQLDPATATFAMASAQGDGDCADRGLDASAGRYVDAYTNVARGQVAEAAGDVNAATDAYRAALAFDADNPMAREGLARLQQPVPEQLPAPDPIPALAPIPPAGGTGTPLTGLLIGAASLLLLVVGLLGWLLRRSFAVAGPPPDRTDEVLRALVAVKAEYEAVHSAAEQQRGRALRDARDELERSVRDSTSTLVEAFEVQGEVAAGRAAALERQIDRLLDFVGSVRRDGAEPIRRRFVRYGTGRRESEP